MKITDRPKLWIDLETFSSVPLTHGVHRYCEAEDAEVLILSWAFEDAPVEVVDITAGERPSPRFAQHVRDSRVVMLANNASFDRNVLRLLAPDWWPKEGNHIKRWFCTMAWAALHSLPPQLGDMGKVLRITENLRKHDNGKKLIHLFCKPLPKNRKLRRATSETHPAEWLEFLAYAGNDIEAMRACAKKLPTWNLTDSEVLTYHLDQRINDRGVRLDVELADAAIQASKSMKDGYDAQVLQLTDGEVVKAGQVQKILEFALSQFGVELPDLRADTLRRRIEDPDMPEPLRDLMQARLAASKTSATKFRAARNSVCQDGRMHGLLRFCGAERTARWSGQRVQPQNLMRTPKRLHGRMDQVVAMIKAGIIEYGDENPIEAVGASVRPMLIPAEGKKLVVCDLSNIEGRFLSWLAGEHWRLRAFERGDDLYVLGYARSFGVTREEVERDHEAGGKMRLIGKVQELALGYQGGAGAFNSMAVVYGLPLFEESRAWELVNAWRQANPLIVNLWWDLERAVKRSLRQRGKWLPVGATGLLRVRTDKAFTRIALPSGRRLTYPQMREEGGELWFLGRNHYTRKWERTNTYGGKLAENVTQAGSRDVLVAGMHAAELHEKPYPVVVHVHDELVTEVPDSPEYTWQELAARMVREEQWMKGLPLEASGYEGYFYRKD